MGSGVFDRADDPGCLASLGAADKEIGLAEADVLGLLNCELGVILERLNGFYQRHIAPGHEGHDLVCKLLSKSLFPDLLPPQGLQVQAQPTSGPASTDIHPIPGIKCLSNRIKQGF